MTNDRDNTTLPKQTLNKTIESGFIKIRSGEYRQEMAAITPALKEISLFAGKKIMEHYGDKNKIQYNKLGAPVTKADLESEQIIIEALKDLFPEYGVVSEEMIAINPRDRLTLPERYWLIDPLDGTKEYLKGNDEFTINIALMENHVPIFGLIHAPALAKTYTAFGLGTASVTIYDPSKDHKTRSTETIAPHAKDNKDAIIHPISARFAPQGGLEVVVSHSHSNKDVLMNQVADLNITTINYMGSALKFCAIAEGDADIYPRPTPTMEWDTAAGQAILTSAGGRVLYETKEGKIEPLKYGKRGFLNPPFIAVGKDTDLPLFGTRQDGLQKDEDINRKIQSKGTVSKYNQTRSGALATFQAGKSSNVATLNQLMQAGHGMEGPGPGR